MKAETVMLLVTQLEKIKNIRSRNSYRAAWVGLVFSVIGLAKLHIMLAENTVNGSIGYIDSFIFVVVFILFIQSLYLIIRHQVNQKFAILIEAVLENKNSKL